MTILFLAVLLMAVGKAWRFFVESTEDVQKLRLLEPWYWFLFLNLLLFSVSGNYDPEFILIGLLIQLALCVWFGISMAWIVQACPHKTAVLQQSWFVKGKTLKFCYRCGTRLPNHFHPHHTREGDSSWQNLLFQVPPHLFQYISFWAAQSLIVLISLFLALRYFKNPDLQHRVVLGAIILVLLVPSVIYFLGRFRLYLKDTKGLIWWDDIKGSAAAWAAVALVLWALVHFFL